MAYSFRLKLVRVEKGGRRTNSLTDKRIAEAVSRAVEEAAYKTGVALRERAATALDDA